MACTSSSPSSAPPVSVAATKDVHRHQYGLHRSDSANDLRYDRAGTRRSRSESQLRCSLNRARAAATEPTRLKSSRSAGMFPFHFSSSFIPSSIRSFLFDSEDDSGKGMRLVEPDESAEQPGPEEGETEKRANWVERLLQVRNLWRDRQQKDDENTEEDDEILFCGCGVSYDSDGEGGQEWDRESFSKLLSPVPWSDTKFFSKLAFLCNMAYVIPEMKAEDLRKHYGLRLVTSSLERKAEAAAIKAKLESDSTCPPPALPEGSDSQQKLLFRPYVAYDIAASAASYVHSGAKGLLSLGGGRGPDKNEADPSEPQGEPLEVEQPTAAVASPCRKVYNSEVAASVAASTMTAVVAAAEAAKQQAAKDLISLYSAPCEWFVCDDPGNHIRCFVIQGSDSLASWQANLFFEPTQFEGMEVAVHRGIYEAAKGIYEQFIPEIEDHLLRHGDRAKLRFTGHSLGGSLALLVSLMLLTRRAVPRYAILPVVTFGSPSIFCGGVRVLEALGLDEDHVCSVMMHRDIVPRTFSCNYPDHVAQVLKRLNGPIRSHPCLNNEKVLYSPLGQQLILQPDETSSPPHPLLPSGSALHMLDGKGSGGVGGASKAMIASALRAFLNSPHPLETLSDPTAYGSEGGILRDHDSSHYLKAINGVVRQNSRVILRKESLHQWWPLFTTPTGLPGLACSVHRHSSLGNARLVGEEVVTGV